MSTPHQDSAEAPSTEAISTPPPSPEGARAAEPANAPSDRVRKTVFLSYSHDDKGEPWYEEVLEYLNQLSVGEDGIDLWDDRQIQASADWNAVITEKLRAAQAAVFLVTPTFLQSEFITRREVPELLGRQVSEGLIVHALIAKPCDWEAHHIADFVKTRQLVHSPERTLEEMEGPERRRILNDLVKLIRKDIGIYRHRNTHDQRAQKLRHLEDALGVEAMKEIASGDSSIVYRAAKDKLDIAVKAMVSRPITGLGQAELHAEFEKSRKLRSPVFTRIFELGFLNGHCVATTDWDPGPTLAKRLWLWRQPKHRPKLTRFLTQLAAALEESHGAELRYLSVHPSNIRLHGSELAPRLYPIDFSSFVARATHAHGVFSFPVTALEYMAPEQIDPPAERDELSTGDGLDAHEEKYRAQQLSDQYTLGLVALSMLEGRPPVQVRALCDVVQLLEFYADPRGYQGSSGTRLEEREWCREMPGLARVIWRMLERAPERRWRDMGEVGAQLRALQLGDANDRPAHASEAKASYTRSIAGKDAFYRRFYKMLFAASPEIAARFGHLEKMRKQRAMLDAAIERILNYREHQDEPTTLSAVANSASHEGLTAKDYEVFGQVFVEALSKERAIDQDALDAWQAVLWPAIDYLKRKAGQGHDAVP